MEWPIIKKLTTKPPTFSVWNNGAEMHVSGGSFTIVNNYVFIQSECRVGVGPRPAYYFLNVDLGTYHINNIAESINAMVTESIVAFDGLLPE